VAAAILGQLRSAAGLGHRRGSVQAVIIDGLPITRLTVAIEGCRLTMVPVELRQTMLVTVVAAEYRQNML
jgi:hypothetical protein